MSWRTVFFLLTSVCWCAPLSLSAQDEPGDTADEVEPEASENTPAEEAPEKTNRGPVARYVTVTNPVDNVIFSRVRNTLVKLQHQAEQEDLVHRVMHRQTRRGS